MLLLYLALACVLIWWSRRRSRSYLEPPEYPGALPLLGHIPSVLGDDSSLLAEFQKASYHCLKIGDATVTRLGFHTDYLIADPEDALTAANSCLEKNFMYSFAKPWLGNGLITAPEPIWKKHRKLLNPTFSQQLMYSFMNIFNRQARRLLAQVARHAGKGYLDRKSDIYQNGIETICMTAMGLDITDDTGTDYTKYVNAVDDVLVIFQKRFKAPWLYFNFAFQRYNLKKTQDKCIEILHNMSNEVIRKWKQKNKLKLSERNIDDNFNNNNHDTVSKCKPFLELLMELSEQHGLFTDEDVSNHVDTIIASGYETISGVLLFTLILIGSYPRVQERLLEELKSVFDNTDRDVTKQDLSQLVYLEAVIKESMRIYPPVPLVARYVGKDVKLKKSTLLAGNTCIISVYGIHRHSMWGDDVEEFRPERWLDRSTLPDNANTFLAFGLGRRNCIGKTYAMTSLKTTLAHFIRRYKVTGDHTKMSMKIEFLLKPVSGYEIAIEERTT